MADEKQGPSLFRYRRWRMADGKVKRDIRVSHFMWILAAMVLLIVILAFLAGTTV